MLQLFQHYCALLIHILARSSKSIGYEELLQTPMMRLYPIPIKSKSLEVEPKHLHFLKLPKSFQCVAMLENLDTRYILHQVLSED